MAKSGRVRKLARFQVSAQTRQFDYITRDFDGTSGFRGSVHLEL